MIGIIGFPVRSANQTVPRALKKLGYASAEVQAIVDYVRGTAARYPELRRFSVWVEARLARLVGPVGQKLRTGRSRNDLVATEARLFVKDAIAEVPGGA